MDEDTRRLAERPTDAEIAELFPTRVTGNYRPDEPIPWADLDPKLRLVFAKRLGDIAGNHIDPAKWWDGMGPAHQREWVYVQTHPPDETGTYATDNARLNANADPDTQVAFDQLASRPSGPTPIDTGTLLDDLVAYLRRFVVFRSEAQVWWVALWVLHTHVFDLFVTTPYLHVTSPTKQSGKSRLVVEVLVPVVARPWPITEPSEAVLFRVIHARHPSLLYDEVDATFGKDRQMAEGLRAIFNAGYRKGANVPRCVGPKFEVTDFDVYSPKAFSGLAGLPDTVTDRSGRIELRRRGRNEPKPDKFRLRDVRQQVAPLVDRIEEWAVQVEPQLVGTNPTLPDVLSDRAQDACEVLAAIADLAGAEWAQRARRAFVEVMGAVEDQDITILLLEHCWDAFDVLDVTRGDRIATEELLHALVGRGDDSPWASWWGNDVDADRLRGPGQRLARLLKPFDIVPTKLRVPMFNSVKMGYYRSAFADSWSRYLAPVPSRSLSLPEKNGTTEQPSSEGVSVPGASEHEKGSDEECSFVPLFGTEQRGARSEHQGRSE